MELLLFQMEACLLHFLAELGTEKRKIFSTGNIFKSSFGLFVVTSDGESKHHW